MRRLCLFAALAVGVAASAQPPDPKKDDPFKIPDLTAKEWKAVGDAGLKAWEVKEGKGEAVKAGATVTVHYTGWTTDGNVFDSSRKRNATYTASLAENQTKPLIKGWQQGIPGMKPGGVRRLVIPPDLGYANKVKPNIPAGSTLVFEVELFNDPTKMPDLDAKEWQPGPRGLKVWDVVVGTGKDVQPGDTIVCHYTGWTTDGRIFDSSRLDKPDQPAGLVTFPLKDMVEGWKQGIPGMREGGMRRLMFPSTLGYGDQGRPPKIPGGATLVFDIEVQKIGR